MNSSFKINQLKRSAQIVELEIEGTEGNLIVSEEIVLDHKLVEGVVLTESQLEILRYEAALLACSKKAKNYLAMRGHSVGELWFKLKQKGYGKKEIDETVRKLKKLGYLDDEAYAMKLAEKYLNEKLCWRSVLIARLRKKVIAKDIAERVVDLVLRNRNEFDAAFEALDKRSGQFTDLELEDAKKKSYNYLSRQGFSYEASKKAFEKLALDMKEEQRN